MSKKTRKKKIRIKGKEDFYRISVFRSNKNIFVQIIDDENSKTLVSASSLKIQNGSNLKAAEQVGEELAKKAKEKNINKVVYDRGPYAYSGRIKALAEAARKHGLVF